MKEVKISFNKATWSNEGTYYNGCYTITRELFNQFKDYVNLYMKKYDKKSIYTSDDMNDLMHLPSLEIENDPWTKKECVYLKITQNNKFISFLKEIGVSFNEKRARGSYNYYLEITN